MELIMSRQYSYHWWLAVIIPVGLAGIHCDELFEIKTESANSEPEQSLCIEQYDEVGNASFTYR